MVPSGSETSTNSLFELLTVYTAVPARVLATPEAGDEAALACATDANGGGGGGGRARRRRRGPGGGGGCGGKLAARVPARRLASSRREESSEPRRRHCWWRKAERERRGFREAQGLGGDSIVDGETVQAFGCRHCATEREGARLVEGEREDVEVLVSSPEHTRS